MPKSNCKSDAAIEFLRKQIKEGVFQVYSKLPSEKELCETLNISRITVRKALGILKDEGLIESHQGSGYFVSDGNIKNLIPVIMSSATDAFRLNEIYQGIQDYFSNTAFSPIMLLSKCDSKRETEIVSEYYNNGFSNMIILPFLSEENVSFYHSMLSEKANIVFVDTKPAYIDCNYVTSCNFTGGYLATKHLIDIGHRKIAFCANDNMRMTNTVIERFNGYKFALSESGIEINQNLVFKKSIPSIKSYARECIAMSGDATAIFCTSDAVALAISNLISEQDKNMAIIGFDNLSFSETSTPSITTVDQNFYEIGRSAAEVLYQRMLNPSMSYENRYIPVKLYPRSTTLNTKI